MFTRIMSWLLLGFLLLGAVEQPVPTPAAPVVVTVDASRLVVFIADVNLASGLQAASRIESLAARSPQPIDIVVNSPGGVIYVNEYIMQAIHIAQVRGITVRCFTTVMAASAAFDIYATCSERYTLRASKFLFHPPRVHLPNGAEVTSDAAVELGKELSKTSDATKARLIKKLGIDPLVFEIAYKAEKFWEAEELQAVCKPGFIIIVDDIKGIPGGLFRFGPHGGVN